MRPVTELRHYRELDSTNAELRRLHTPHNLAIYADHQTGGRGQRGNVWCSQPECNLLFSLLWHPDALPPSLQFALSEATALTVVALLKEYGAECKVKWPNDIYAGNSKICGILIENAVSSTLESSIIGIGLNLHQTDFPSSLPNPVSLQSLGLSAPSPREAALRLTALLEEMLPLAESEQGRQQLHNDYLQALYRNDNRPHPYRDPADGTCFNAIITDVEPTGFLHLLTPAGNRRFAFKEIEYLPEQ